MKTVFSNKKVKVFKENGTFTWKPESWSKWQVVRYLRDVYLEQLEATDNLLELISAMDKPADAPKRKLHKKLCRI